jgi:glycosyltransferase involved in cell wall biosynthesis
MRKLKALFSFGDVLNKTYKDIRSSIKTSVLKAKYAKELTSDFDHTFYEIAYPDLSGLQTKNQLLEHYCRYGRFEGRHKNVREAMNELTQRYGAIPASFDVSAYRVLNEDLVGVLPNNDLSYIEHYLRYGQQEGRRCSFDGFFDGAAPKWLPVFRTGDFINCAGDWLTKKPTSRKEAIKLFIDYGIKRLAPININYIFNAEFYRKLAGLSTFLSDSDLYQHWLEVGFAKGFAPNEEAYVRDLLGKRSFPRAFDFVRYKRLMSLRESARLRTRGDALRHFFEGGFERGLGKMIKGDAADLFVAVGDYHLIRGNYATAIKAYNKALLSLPPRAAGSVHLRMGDAMLASRQLKPATDEFKSAAALPSGPLWATVNAVRCLAQQGEFQEAFSMLERARDRWLKNVEYRKVVREVVNLFYDWNFKEADQLYLSGERASGDQLIEHALDEICRRIEGLEGLPCAVDPSPIERVVILANQDLPQCTYYRVEQKRRQLEHEGVVTEIFKHHDVEQFLNAVAGAHRVIFYRVPAFPDIVRAILTVKALGIPTYYDIDDLIFDPRHYPDSYESYENQISYEEYAGLIRGVPMFRYAMSLCDYGIASTPPLATEVAKIVAKGHCILLRNGLDERSDDFVALGEKPPADRPTVTIFYGSGTKAHNSDFNENAGPALLSIMSRHQNVQLVIVGHLQLRAEFDRFAERVRRLPLISDISQYWLLLASADINLAVLAPNMSCDCKSEIKWLEAAVVQIPSVVSDTATYKEALKNGVDALLAEADPRAWEQAIERLVLDAALRRSIGSAARRKALANYALDRSSRDFCAALGIAKDCASTLATPLGRTPSSGKKPLIMICNVLFPPQISGGATRVVRDNVDYLIDHHPEFSLSVLTTDEGVSSPGILRYDAYRDVPVFRLSTPLEHRMDWRPFNDDHVAIFDHILRQTRPDLIHFHCIQRLTATIVERTRKLEIPYLITAHDGWWISDHQFLVDEDDFLRVPSSDMYASDPNSEIPTVESVSRRRRLSALLGDAERVLAVSDSFARIYSDAGVENVLSVPNGVSRIKRLPRRNRSDGRVALGHIGGRGAHKGGRFVEAVLRRNSFQNLHLTIVDLELEASDRIETTWGDTPVAIVGPYPSDQVAELYASLDVLLAPSIWPESFGLVTREALSAGLWVVASDRGAVGEDVLHGENGFIVDVSDDKAFCQALQEIDRSPQRFRSSPPLAPRPPRTSDDQGEELVRIYQDILHPRETPSARPTSTETSLSVRA